MTERIFSPEEARGLLCRICNIGLGTFKDSEARLLRAISYLQHGPPKR